MIKTIMFIFLMLTINGCATWPKCHEIGDIIERTKCYESEKQNRYYQQNGWKYDTNNM